MLKFVPLSSAACLLLISLGLVSTPVFTAETFQPEVLWPQLTNTGHYFNFPESIARDDQGLFYILNGRSHQIKVLTAHGELLRTWGGFGRASGQLNRPFSIALTASNKVLVSDLNNHRIQVFTTDGVYIQQWGRFGSGNGQFNLPTGLAIDKEGLIYVSDTGNHRVQIFNEQGQWLQTIGRGILRNPKGVAVSPTGELFVAEGRDSNRISIFNATGQYLRSFGRKGSEFGQFDSPDDLKIDAQGLLYVTEYGNHRIQVFTQQGQFIRSWGKEGQTGADLWTPAGMFIDNQSKTVHVADTSNNRIQRYSLQGNYQGAWQSQGSATGEFASPRASISPQGDIYVADYRNHRIQVFTQAGKWLRNFGERGDQPGQFQSPSFIAFDSQGRVYISDLGNDRIQIFDQQGRYLSHWGVSGRGKTQLIEPSGLFISNEDLLYISDDENRIQVFTLDGTWVRSWGNKGNRPGQFDEPIGIVVDGTNQVYVADRRNNRIQVFDKKGRFLRQWGTLGDDNGKFHRPTGLALSPDGLLYIADAWNNRIQIYQRDGTFVESMGEAGTQPGQFGQPYTVALIDENTLLVGEFANNRIQLLRRHSTERATQKAIILAGGGPSAATYTNPIWKSTELLTNNAYFALRAQGFNKDAIKYLSSGNVKLDLDENGKYDDLETATLVSLGHAITNWARDAQDVIIYLNDHGGPGSFKINQHEILDREQLGIWLNQLQNQISGKLTIIIEACQSASFFTGLGTVDRYFIASADKQQPAVISNKGMNSFSYHFWYAVRRGEPLQKAFRIARQGMSKQEIIVEGKSQTQNAQLDADGNEIFDSNDYTTLADYCLGQCNLLAAAEPQLTPITTSSTITKQTQYTLAVKVSSLAPIESAWAIINRPDLNYTDLNQPVSNLPKISLPCSTESTGKYDCQGDYKHFDVDGKYSITFHARDTGGKNSIPQALITLEKTQEIPPAPPTPPQYSATYDTITGIAHLYDVIANGVHYQATLQPQNGQFVATEIDIAKNQFATASVYYFETGLLIIPKIQVLDHYYSAVLQQQPGGLIFTLTGATDLGLIP